MLDRVHNFLRGLQRSPAFRYLRRDIRAKIGGVIVLLVVFTAIFAGVIARHDPTTKNKITISELLGGATFKVEPNPYGGAFLLVTDNVTPDSDNTLGIILLQDVPVGTYTVTENVAPARYKGDNTINVIDVTSQASTTVTFTNRFLGKIRIRKLDEENKLLGGATFKVEPNPYGGAFLLVTDNVTPDSDNTLGIILLQDVPADTYTVTENVAPKNFLRDNTIKVFDITSQATISTVTFTNRVLGKIQTKKLDEENKLLGGATFKVEPNPYGGAFLLVTDNVTPDSDNTLGIILLQDVPADTYTVTENVGKIEIRNVENKEILERFQGPSMKYPFGTDDSGRDIFSRVVYGARTALLIGILLVVVQTSIGLPLGLLAGYRGGKVDNVIMRLVDAVLAMPGLIIALAFVAVFGPGIYKVVLALAVTGWAGYARLMRGQTLAIKEEPYIEAARAVGEKDRNIIFRYVLPNAISPLIVMVTMTFPAAILLSSSMSFLGLGVQPPAPDWGYDLNAYRIYMADPMPAPLMSIIPGIIMVITIFGFNFFGDALRDAYDPRLRE